MRLSFSRRLCVSLCLAFSTSACLAAEAQVYGVLDLNLASYRPSYQGSLTGAQFDPGTIANRRSTAVGTGGRGMSFVGFSAQERLGDSAKVMVQLEAALAGDTGAVSDRNFWHRQARVGIQDSDWGALWAGRSITLLAKTYQDFSPLGESPYNPALRLLQDHIPSLDLYGRQLVNSGVIGAAQGGAREAMAATSWSNSLTLTLPTIEDLDALSVGLQWGAREGDANGHNIGVALRYDGEVVDTAYAFQSVKAGLASSPSMRNDLWVAATAIDLDPVKLFMQVGQNKVEFGGATIRANYQMLGAQMLLTSSDVVHASLGLLNNKPLDTRHRWMTLGYERQFSKDTQAYTDLVYERLDLVGLELDPGLTLVLGVRHRY
ncbi:porin [Aquabacterium lacunae]|uniref:Porin n=1 Tax=Aquabacterium lacunae TaxID=2528630 RepID=A0A4V2JFP4_9BURK|nr:porin [Aquabacterium lacunae]TBO31298.1 porin [Aquabacterium lacunae]